MKSLRGGLVGNCKLNGKLSKMLSCGCCDVQNWTWRERIKEANKEIDSYNEISDNKEYNEVLYELGILDDEEDWNLFCKMQAEQMEQDPDLETWCKAMGIVPREIPKD